MTIWTTIEPLVGLICSCLPTLRPLLREVWIKVGPLRASIHSLTVSTWANGKIQLDSEQRHQRTADKSQATKRVDNLNYLQDSDNAREGASKTTVEASATDSDDIMLMGINVQHDVHVERANDRV